MSDPLADQVIAKIPEAASLRSRLVLLVAPHGAGKTKALLEAEPRADAPRVNVSLELSRRMLELTDKQRALEASKLLGDILKQTGRDVLLLDNIELLFEPSLQLDPLRLLEGLSRDTTLVVAWPGEIHAGRLTYASHGHPEYREYSTEGLLIIHWAPQT